MRSKEYLEGFAAESYSDNPYDPASHEFDEFERGRTQKIKRQPESAFGGGIVDIRYGSPSNHSQHTPVVKPYKYKAYKGK